MTEAITIKDVYEEIQKLKSAMITKEEFSRLVDTIEIISNPETMDQIKDSEHDIKSGKVKKVSSVNDLI